jgi:uncharacterized membrane protein YdjX (TVP38/TMEM64 family)
MSGIGTEAETKGMASRVRRHATIVRWVSLALSAVSVLLIVRRLPIGPAIQAMEGWVTDLGIWGPVFFGLIYAAAVVLMVPGSALTLAAGAIFGPLVGTMTVSLASTTGAALAFLVARYLARDAVVRQAHRHPKFDAIDRAIGENGWKIIALLRLSPAFPFGIQNYLYGLTRIGFRSYVLTSWIAMLPGTVMYVYLGHVGRAGVEVASGGGRSRSPFEWALIVVGLLATIAVTVYVADLAREAIGKQIEIAEADETKPVGRPEIPEPKGWPWGETIAVAIAVVAVAAAAFAQFAPGRVAKLFGSLAGPRSIVLKGAAGTRPGGPASDHATRDAIPPPISATILALAAVDGMEYRVERADRPRGG